MIQETITAINAQFAALLINTPSVKCYPVARPVNDQQANAIRLMLAGTDQRVTIDSKFNWQSVPILLGNTVNRTASTQFGTVMENRYDISLVLAVAARLPELTEFVSDAFVFTGRIRVEGFETDTVEVLRKYWYLPVDQARNYDPAMSAVAVRFTIIGVEAEELNGFLAEPLPIDLPGQDQDTETTPRHYEHTQPTAAATWTINHNMGFKPAGIRVFDSADEEWFANVHYLNDNSLILSFGMAAFAGKAFIS